MPAGRVPGEDLLDALVQVRQPHEQVIMPRFEFQECLEMAGLGVHR